MKKGILTARHLSASGFILRPQYRHGQPPLSLSEDDRLFDPDQDEQTHEPEYLATLEDKQDFSHKILSGVHVYLLIIKRPQSDIYLIPKDLEPYTEFLQRSLDHEHNRSALAFTCAAYLAVRQGTSTANMWHFDQGDRIRTDYPSRTYLAVDRQPTQYMFNHKFRHSERLIGQFRSGVNPHAFELMTRLSGNRDLERHPVRGRDIRSYDPYDVVTHDRMVLHRGIDGRDRTGIVLYYSSSDSFYRRDIQDNPMNPGMKSIRSAPYQQAPSLLNRYLTGASP